MSKRLGILVLIIFMFLGTKSYAQSQFSPTISKMEKSLFGIDYSNQPDEARLKRIESVVYGQPSSTAVAQRVGKLSKDLSADLMGQEIKPKEDTFAEDESAEPKEVIPKADSNINYPSVDNLEKEAFNKEFKNLDISQRLTNLEQKVFRKTFNDDLNTRVDRLKAAIVPEKVVEENESQDEDNSNIYEPQDILSQNAPSREDFLSSKYSSAPRYNSQKSVLDEFPSNTDIEVPLSALEKKVLKQSFPNDAIPNRLSRLEVRMFNSDFSDDDEQTRMDRIASAYQAQKTSKKYDGNKASQRVSTAVQVGAILLMILAAVL